MLDIHKIGTNKFHMYLSCFLKIDIVQYVLKKKKERKTIGNQTEV